MKIEFKKAVLTVISLVFLIGTLETVLYIDLTNLLEIQTYIRIAISFMFLSLSLGIASIINIEPKKTNVVYLIPIFLILYLSPLMLKIKYDSLNFLAILILIIPYLLSFSNLASMYNTFMNIPYFSFFLKSNNLMALVLSALLSLNFFTSVQLNKENLILKSYIEKAVDIAGEKVLELEEPSSDPELPINSISLDLQENKEALKALVKKYGINFQRNPAIAVLNTANSPKSMENLKKQALENTKQRLMEQIFIYMEDYKTSIKIFFAVTLFGYLNLGLRIMSYLLAPINFAMFNLLVTTGFLEKVEDSIKVKRYRLKEGVFIEEDPENP